MKLEDPEETPDRTWAPLHRRAAPYFTIYVINITQCYISVSVAMCYFSFSVLYHVCAHCAETHLFFMACILFAYKYLNVYFPRVLLAVSVW